MRTSRTFMAVAGMAVLAGTLGMSTSTAFAKAQGRIGQREAVCAKSLTLRDVPGGAVQGTLGTGESFQVQSRHGEWVRGFAYGNVNKVGYVLDGWFCRRKPGGEFIID